MGVTGLHLTLGALQRAGEQVRACGHGDSARHCRHRGDGAPVLPVRRPVVPVDLVKTEMPFLFGPPNNSRKIYQNSGNNFTR